MKKVMVEMYEALDGTRFASPSAARQRDVDMISAGTRPTGAMVTRAVARTYALWLMGEGGGTVQGKEAWHFGRCEVEMLLDLIYGHRRDGTPINVPALLGEIKV